MYHNIPGIMKCVLLLHLIWDRWNININSLFLAFSVTNPQELKGIYLKDVYINSYDLGTITKMHKQSLNVKAVFLAFLFSRIFKTYIFKCERRMLFKSGGSVTFLEMPLSNNYSKIVQHVILKCHRLIRDIQILQFNSVFTSGHDFLFHGLWFCFLIHICAYWQISLCSRNNKEEMEMNSKIRQWGKLLHSHSYPFTLSLYTTQLNYNFFLLISAKYGRGKSKLHEVRD